MDEPTTTTPEPELEHDPDMSLTPVGIRRRRRGYHYLDEAGVALCGRPVDGIVKERHARRLGLDLCRQGCPPSPPSPTYVKNYPPTPPGE